MKRNEMDSCSKYLLNPIISYILLVTDGAPPPPIPRRHKVSIIPSLIVLGGRS